MLPAGMPLADGLLFRSALLRPAQNEGTILGAVMAFVRELFGWRLKLNWEERLIYWVFALLILTLVLLVSYVLGVAVRWTWRKLRRLRLQARRESPEIEFYTRFCQQMEQ